MTRRFRQPFWIVPLAMAALVAVLGWWANDRLRQTIEEELKSDLDSTLDANVTALQIWTTNQMRMATALTEEPAVRKLSLQILDQPILPPRPNTPQSTEATDLANFLRPRLNHFGYQTAQLVSTNFLIAASTLRGRQGVGAPVSEAHSNKFAEVFAAAQPVLITPFKPEMLFQRREPRAGFPRGTNFLARFNRPPPGNNFARSRRGDLALMQIAAPIREGNVVRGALAMIINPTNEFSRILSVARKGDSGETYAFDQTGLLISESRFDIQLRVIGLLGPTNESSALNLRLFDPGGDLTKGFKSADTNGAVRPLIGMVANAVAGEDGVDVVPRRDYRGVPVVAAWRWLPEFGFGVGTQIDADEAYRPLHLVQLIFVLLFSLLALSAVCLFVFSYVNVASRKRLGEAELKLKQLGQYVLEEKIGEGGMGVVYRARHALLRRDTAVKLLLPDRADAESLARFEREVRLTCQLTHPNTIQIFDYGHTPDGVFYYAMEFLTGLNLQQLVTKFGPQPEGRVINILLQICNSLAEAHAAGLVHRDIKPSNVFISNRGGVPDYVKLLDFGLVREYTETSLEKGGEEEVVGTPLFMSPESIRNSMASDPRSDIYAIGALAYYLLTAQYVFAHESLDEIHEKQMTTAPTPPGKVTKNPISPEFEQVILKCLERERDARPQSAMELAGLLSNCPTVNDWTPEARLAWWTEYQQHPLEAGHEKISPSSIPTVRVDLADRNLS